MATCAELEQQASQAANELVRLTSAVSGATSYNITTVAGAEQFGGAAADLLTKINRALSALERIQTEQIRQDCPRTGYVPEKRAARNAQKQLNAFLDKAEAIIFKAREEQQATQKATTSQDNSGTGAPGTAGTGAGATPNSDELKEIEIQSKKVPEEVEVTGRRRAEDGLDEVEVTGKRSPDPLEEVQVTGKRTPEELEEVQITSSRRNTNQGLEGELSDARAQANKQDSANYAREGDWRVRLSLAPEANYLYRVPKGEAGILEPLQATDGVIFPYTPSITINYIANYGATRITHANYPVYQYENSSIDSISINCDFTAQDTFEANYLLAVIHFFRSVTKMFYGKDQNPTAGTPPPLCYLFGLGAFQFNAHPLVITSFNYSLPTDVDYIRATTSTTTGGVNRSASNTPDNSTDISSTRLQSGQGNLIRNGEPRAAQFSTAPAGSTEPTYVPTRIQMQLSAYPLVSRNVVSAAFSLKDYATGKLMRGIDNVRRGGLW